MAEQARDALDLSEVWLMVSPQNPLKDTANMAPFEARMHMCTLMATGKPWLKASDFEAKAKTQFTADTVEKLTKTMPENTFFWLMGADNLAQFHKWKDWEKIAKTLPIVVFRRPDTDIAKVKGPAVDFLAPYKVEANSPKVSVPNWRVLENKMVDLSATNIRNGAVTQGTPALDNEVQRYISDKKLYRNTTAC